jgi:hypothetical protein
VWVMTTPVAAPEGSARLWRPTTASAYARRRGGGRPAVARPGPALPQQPYRPVRRGPVRLPVWTTPARSLPRSRPPLHNFLVSATVSLCVRARVRTPPTCRVPATPLSRGSRGSSRRGRWRVRCRHRGRVCGRGNRARLLDHLFFMLRGHVEMWREAAHSNVKRWRHDHVMDRVRQDVERLQGQCAELEATKATLTAQHGCGLRPRSAAYTRSAPC